ncbi:unnamed protein product [Caenorhabditis brenneri]
MKNENFDLLKKDLLKLKEKIKARIPKNLSIPDIIQYIHVLVSIIGVIIGFGFFIGSIGYKWDIGLGVMGTWALILGLVMFVKKFLKNLHSGPRVVTIGQSKTSMLFGLFGSILLAFLPRVYVICDPYNGDLNLYFMFVSLPSISLIYMLFIAKSKKNYQITYETTEALPWLILTLNYILLFVSLKLSFTLSPGSQDGTFWVQILMTPITTVLMMEFFQVLRGKLVAVNRDDMVEEKEEKTSEKPLLVEGSEGQPEILKI